MTSIGSSTSVAASAAQQLFQAAARPVATKVNDGDADDLPAKATPPAAPLSAGSLVNRLA